jgi:hypothetical protein
LGDWLYFTQVSYVLVSVSHDIIASCFRSLKFISKGALGYGQHVTTLTTGIVAKTFPYGEGRRRPRPIDVPRALGLALGLIGCVLAVAAPASAGGLPDTKSPFTGYFDFATCVRYALVHSETLLKNRLEIQIRSVDLKNAHAELVPKIELITLVYINRATGNDQSPLYTQIYTPDWNPFLGLLKIKNSEILVDMAKISHSEKIADDIAAMGKIFYSISAIEKTIKIRKQMVALYQDKVNYGRSKSEQGTLDSLQLRLWSNNLKGAQLKIKDLEGDLEDKVAELKMLMGYNPDYHLALDTRDAANQILGGFNGQFVTFSEIQGSNLGLKLAAKKEQVQSNLVTGSYVALVPRPNLLMQNIQNEVDRTSGFNFAVGFNYTLWDGFRRVREIKTQKLRAEQMKLDREQLSQKLYNGFKRIRSGLGVSGERWSFVREQANLAELSEEKALIQYKAGGLTYDQYMDRRIETAQAQMDSLAGPQERVLGLIDLATLAGGLNKYNARIAH